MNSDKDISKTVALLIFVCSIFSTINAQNVDKVNFKALNGSQLLKITGVIRGLEENERVFLSKFNFNSFKQFDVTSFELVDTGIVKDGTFVLEDNLTDGPRLYMFVFSKHKQRVATMLGNGNVKMTTNLNLNDVPTYYPVLYFTFEGSDVANDFLNSRAIKNAWRTSFVNINAAIDVYKDSTLSKSNLEYICGLMSAKAEINNGIGIIFNKTTRKAGFCELFTEQSNPADIKYDSIWRDLYNSLDDETKKTYYGKILREYLPLLIGQAAPNFSFVTSHGKASSLKEVTRSNKLTLLCFWSSDVSTSNRYPFNDELKKHYKKYHPKGFDIINVSLDANQDKWKRLIKEENVPGYHTYDPKEEEGDIAKSYKLPQKDMYTILIDEKGKIVAWEVYGLQLQVYLYRIFGE